MPGRTGIRSVGALRERPHLGPVGQGEGGVVVEDCGVGQLKIAAGTLMLYDDPAGQSVEDQGDGVRRCDECGQLDPGGHVLAVRAGDQLASA